MRSLALLAFVASASAADPAAFDRTIAKEPAYAGTPAYLLLAFGPDAARVWAVRDGDTLYVDRNGNGDLTDPGEAIRAEFPQGDGRAFAVRTVAVGGRVHRQLTVSFVPLAVYAGHPDWTDHPAVRAALAADPKAEAVTVGGSVESGRLKGAGVGGRADCSAGPLDADGPLVLGASAKAAPVVWFDGPLTVAVEGRLPTARPGRGFDLRLNLGTRGAGPGTFAAVGYTDCIPAGAHPVAELTLPAKEKGASPVTVRTPLKDRC
ncbi:MAG: hypothetical protein U0871_13740 [Gemmataceae bacterium]